MFLNIGIAYFKYMLSSPDFKSKMLFLHAFTFLMRKFSFKTYSTKIFVLSHVAINAFRQAVPSNVYSTMAAAHSPKEILNYQWYYSLNAWVRWWVPTSFHHSAYNNTTPT